MKLLGVGAKIAKSQAGKALAREVGKTATQAGIQIIGDVLQGENALDSTKKRLKTAGKQVGKHLRSAAWKGAQSVLKGGKGGPRKMGSLQIAALNGVAKTKKKKKKKGEKSKKTGISKGGCGKGKKKKKKKVDKKKGTKKKKKKKKKGDGGKKCKPKKKKTGKAGVSEKKKKKKNSPLKQKKKKKKKKCEKQTKKATKRKATKRSAGFLGVSPAKLARLSHPFSLM